MSAFNFPNTAYGIYSMQRYFVIIFVGCSSCDYVRCILQINLVTEGKKDCVCSQILNNAAAPAPGMTEVLLSWKYWWPLHPAQQAGINRPCVKRFTHSFTSRLQFHPLGRCLTHIPSFVMEWWWGGAKMEVSWININVFV